MTKILKVTRAIGTLVTLVQIIVTRVDNLAMGVAEGNADGVRVLWLKHSQTLRRFSSFDWHNGII